jgi:isopentenyl phosphate kinase
LSDLLQILKIGGSVITDKSKPMSVNLDVINSIASQIAKFKKSNLLIVHGGGSFGHPLAKKYNLANGLKSDKEIISISKTHQAMLDLNNIIIKSFIDKNIPVISLSPIDIFYTSNGRIEKSFLDPIKTSLRLSLIPILFGDTVYDLKKGISILSGDQLVTYLGIKLKAKRIILGTDTDGLFTSDPKHNHGALLIEEIRPDNYKEIVSSFKYDPHDKKIDVTGGMLGKLNELINAAKNGIEIFIINAKYKNNIEKILNNEKVKGTRFTGWNT